MLVKPTQAMIGQDVLREVNDRVLDVILIDFSSLSQI